MKHNRFAHCTRLNVLLFTLCLSLMVAILLGGCGGGKNDKTGYTPDFDRQILVEFRAELPEQERTAIYEKYNIRFLGPFGDRPNSYLLLLRDDMDELEVETQLERESGVVEVIRRPAGPH